MSEGRKKNGRLSVDESLMLEFDSIPWARPNLWGNEQAYVAEALASSWISGGPFVERLEKEFAGYCGVPYAITASNGTTALHMAFLALGVSPGDEVIVPGFAFMAAANVALHLHAKPVFTEVDPLTWCMTAAEVDKCLTPKTRAVVPVHTYGNVCPMNEILELVTPRRIAVVEDTAEAFASRYKNRMAGTLGDVGTFSFHATKTITTGEGGMVVTQSRELYDKMCLFRNHGMARIRYWHEVAGHNFRLTNMQAALGCAQLENIDQIACERRRVHSSYKKHLLNIPGVTMQKFCAQVDPTLWAIAVRLDPQAYPQGRDAVIDLLQLERIETRPGFYAASLMAHLYAFPRLRICEDLSHQVISLPTFPTLQDDQVEFICAKLKGLRK